MIDIILDTLIDSLKLLPFLFIAFLIIELIEHKLNKQTKELVSKSGKVGPLIGSLLGLFPHINLIPNSFTISIKAIFCDNIIGNISSLVAR